MRENPKPFEIYRHFKGNLYQILTLALDSEDTSVQVVYQALYGDYKVYVRPLNQFMSETDREKYPEVQQRFRFERVRAAGQEADAVQENAEIQTAGGNLSQEQPEAGGESKQRQALTGVNCPEETKQEEETGIDASVLAFLDADTYEAKLNILTSLHHRITDEMLDTMAVAVDVEINSGEMEERYIALRNCLLTRDKFERVRLR